MNKFEFKKTYEEIEIGDKVYNLDLKAEGIVEKLNSYNKELKEIEKNKRYNETEILEQMNDNLTDDHVQKIKEIFEEKKVVVKKSIELFLGPGTFDSVYEASGESIVNCIDLLNWIQKKYQKSQEEITKKKIGKYKKNE